MALEAKLVQKLGQSLLMTPQLQQAIKLLQLGRLDYLEAIEKELLENPVLEEIREGPDRAGETSADAVSGKDSNTESESRSPTIEGDGSNDLQPNEGQEPKSDWDDYLESFTDARGASLPKNAVDWEDRPSLEATLTRSETLSEHMAAQIRLSDLQGSDLTIALHVIGNLARDGYLQSSHEEIAATCECELQDVERVVSVVQYLDPPGVASRNLQECLLVQLDVRGLGESLAARIVRDHLEKVEKRRFDQIAKAEDLPQEQISEAMNIIRALDPHPGRAFADDETRYAIPDIYVYKDGNEYVISLNDEGLPKLRLSPYYLDLLKNKDAANAPNKEYLNERLKAASWLIKSIHQRQQTIYRVTESIVKFQREFLDRGIQHLKPMVLKDVADDIGMHESTVSRVTSNKYVHTPQGVFELKFFFTTALKSSSGADVSSSSIKERIKSIIAAENIDTPISDQSIVDQLKADGVEIARRTVAKYREGLNIPSSSLRKRTF